MIRGLTDVHINVVTTVVVRDKTADRFKAEMSLDTGKCHFLHHLRDGADDVPAVGGAAEGGEDKYSYGGGGGGQGDGGEVRYSYGSSGGEGSSR